MLPLQLLAALAAAPAPAPITPPRVQASIAAEFGTVLFLTAGPSPSALALSVSQRLWWPRGFRLDLGFRTLLGSQYAAGAAVEGFARIALAPAFGAWRPSVALEVGVSAATRLVIADTSLAPGNDLRSRVDFSPVYIGFGATPVRFQFGRFSFAIGSLTAGTDLMNPGRMLRVDVSAVQFAWRFL